MQKTQTTYKETNTQPETQLYANKQIIPYQIDIQKKYKNTQKRTSVCNDKNINTKEKKKITRVQKQKYAQRNI